MRRKLTAYWLGRIGYDAAHRLQQRLVEARVAGRVGDVVLLLEHDAVITLGRSAKADNVLAADDERAAKGVELVETGRGGDVTFHGPGQLVAYPIVDLKPDRCDVRRYIGDLAEVMVRLAKDHGVAAGVVPGDSKLVGVWVDEAAPSEWDEDRARDASIGVPNGARLAKIGAIGVRLSRWVTMHGFAFNVSTDLSGFDLIVPCGIRELDVTSLARLGVAAPSIEDVARASRRHFADVLDADVVEADPKDLDASIRAA
ncbi:MAG: lipoyl(octanoyl) transferase LipB [Labilithrix sp.]|nr:lipoyl(octanoyl) transferase LipB [Labilithrix sp.]MCW5837210.1 lipoyl(octanoyl) transferase LipB [Labilithrix sp.]